LPSPSLYCTVYYCCGPEGWKAEGGTFSRSGAEQRRTVRVLGLVWGLTPETGQTGSFGRPGSFTAPRARQVVPLFFYSSPRHLS
jgi:hypothetical protein